MLFLSHDGMRENSLPSSCVTGSDVRMQGMDEVNER